ncbi:hypothetical protein B5G34_14755 [Flavonifractor sp. An82]|uniref:DUF554 domain-containing protein n=1 Tax=Flavonifractor sp. An82 TaxID=1965660 RepID=UPI000B3683D0|nr:DUF554 domain-containing protein [Flavonifractor sp. An82]OUN20443.1 hypothetical protein B5G34_14755 [Flavonifractor sp. An82]
MLIPKGILIDCCCVLFGTNLGSLLKDRVPQTIKEPMNVIFGLAAIAIGITSIIKLQTLPAVILALILGGLIGELLGLDGKVRRLFQSAIERLHFRIPGDRDAYMQFYLLVAVTLCASGTNIFGAINEGISGDFTILLSKGVMDIFAATIFAATLGRAMNLIVLPQFLILCACFYGAQFILPLTTPAMLNDFVAMGGLLTFVLGLSIARIKHISAVNLLPCLFLIWPCSWLFGLIA